MRVALTIYLGRISPLFDGAGTLLLVDIEEGQEVRRVTTDIRDLSPLEKVAKLVELKVDVLICGAIDRSIGSHLAASGVRVLPWVAGDASDVLRLVTRTSAIQNPKPSQRKTSMRIAVTSIGPDLDSQVDPRFGRCPYLIFIEEDDSFQAEENPNAELGGGAGIQTATTVADRGVDVVLTGRCGPNAFGTLRAADIRIMTGAAGSVREAVQRYREGALTEATQPGRHGYGKGARGGGRGMGRMGLGSPDRGED